MKMEVVTSFDREKLVRRSVCRDGQGIIFFRSQKMDRESLVVETFVSAYRPEAIPVFVGLYLKYFHGSDTVEI